MEEGEGFGHLGWGISQGMGEGVNRGLKRLRPQAFLRMRKGHTNMKIYLLKLYLI